MSFFTHRPPREDKKSDAPFFRKGGRRKVSRRNFFDKKCITPEQTCIRQASSKDFLRDCFDACSADARKQEGIDYKTGAHSNRTASNRLSSLRLNQRVFILLSMRGGALGGESRMAAFQSKLGGKMQQKPVTILIADLAMQKQQERKEGVPTDGTEPCLHGRKNV